MNIRSWYAFELKGANIIKLQKQRLVTKYQQNKKESTNTMIIMKRYMDNGNSVEKRSGKPTAVQKASIY